MASEKKRKKRTAAGLVLVGCAAVLAYFLYRESLKYIEAEKTYEKVQEEFVDDEFLIDWEALLAACPDVTGWIRMDSGADYPVVYSGDDEYYLHRDIYGDYSYGGSIFVSGVCDPSWDGRNTIVYGHNMINGSMFGTNKKYKDSSYTEEHPWFYIYTPEGCGHYRIFATMTVDDGTETYTVNFSDDEGFLEYINDMISLRSYAVNAETPDAGDRIVTLSTCTNRGKDRFVIQGYLDTFVEGEGVK